MKSYNSNRIALISNRVAVGALSSMLLLSAASSALAQQLDQSEVDTLRATQTGQNPNAQLDQQGGLRQRGGRNGGRGQQNSDFNGNGGRNQQNGGDFNGNGGGQRGNRQQYVQYSSQTVQSGADSFAQEYGVLSEHNIFLRYRGIPERPRMADVVGPRSPEEANILTSLVKDESGEWRAYIEDVSQGVTRKLQPNDPVANGKVLDFTMTSIVYQAPGAAPVTVPIGSNLTGVVSSVGNSRVTSALGRTGGDFTGYSNGQNNLPLRGGGGNFGGGLGNNNGGGRRGGGFTPTPTVVVPPTALPGSESMSLEERMRLRRAAETLPGAAVPQSAAPAPAAAAPQPEAAPAPAPIVDPAVGGNLSIEEQMRLRRLQGR